MRDFHLSDEKGPFLAGIEHSNGDVAELFCIGDLGIRPVAVALELVSLHFASGHHNEVDLLKKGVLSAKKEEKEKREEEKI